MRASILSPLIPLLRNDALEVTVTPPGETTVGPPLMPHVLRGHRLVKEALDEGNHWWVRVDDNDFNGPASRRSLDSAVYQIFKPDKLQDPKQRRKAWWLSDLFDKDNGDTKALNTTTPSTNASTPNATASTSPSTTENGEQRPGNPIPLPSNIDATQFPPSYVPPINDIEREFMVVSGGFTDVDWTSFPVWAFELNQTSPGWRDLSGLNVGHAGRHEDEHDKNTNSSTLWPPGRVGHVSALNDGDLYIFGGMLWNDKSFMVEEAPYVWKARVEHKLGPHTDDSVLEWERIIPEISYYKDLHIDDSAASNNTVPDDVPKSGQENDLTRGECRGGHWKEGSGLVFYGGLHVKHQLTNNRYHDQQQDVALGDVWMYNYTTQTLEQLSPYPPPESQRDEWGRYPVARTAHAATVVGNSLLVYGGMTSSAWSATREYDGLGAWEELSDVWVFDLIERKWSERFMTPALSRSYHSMVGWGDGSLGVFGGFRTARTIAGEPIAFVFSDTLVSHPNDPTWWKAKWPEEPGNGYEMSASNRLEHTSAVDKFGSMYVWGGRFKTVSQIHGMWSLDVFNADSKVAFEPAPPDELEAYEAELEALHMLVAVMLLMSVLFTGLYGTLRRQAMEQEGSGNGNAMGILGRRRGLSREAIDAIPIKTYGAEDESSPAPDATPENDSDAGGLSDVPMEEEECCPICLLEYEQGDELRLLPCHHEFHKECIDSWLENNTSCPACRHSLSSTVPDEGVAQEPDGIWRYQDEVDNITMIPTVTLTQLLAGREISMFGPLENVEESAATDASAPEANGADAEESNDNAEEEEQNLGAGARRRRFRFSRYFSLPQSRASEAPEETLGDTEMTTIGESSSRPSLQMV